MKTRDKWHKEAIRTKDKLYWNAYRFFRQEVKREIRITEREYIRNEININNGNNNSIWKIINRCLPRKDPTPTTIEDPQTQANVFNEFYTSVGISAASKAKTLGIWLYNPRSTNFQDSCRQFDFHPVTEKDIERIVKSLPSNKAPGHDKITARVLKDSLPVTISVITNLINRSFSSNTFAEVWKSAEVIPILKSGDFEEPLKNLFCPLCPK